MVPMENREMEQLGRRAIACKRWRWMAGMATLNGQRVLRVEEMGDGDGILSADWSTGAVAHNLMDEWEGEIPDIEDAATLGCLLTLVREAWPPDPDGDSRNCADTYFETSTNEWHCDVFDESKQYCQGRFGRSTEAEALIAALESVP